MAIDVHSTFAKGGRELLGFLSFCVMAYRLEPIFVFFHREHTLLPSPERALALYDCFCAPAAPARLREAQDMLPPRNVRFAAEMEALRDRVTRCSARMNIAPGEPLMPVGSPAEPDESAVGDLPPPNAHAASGHLQQLAVRLATGSASPVVSVGLGYDPSLTPTENLPGRRMSPAARAFVDSVWRPRVAPVLVSAGFRHAANLA